MKKFIKVIIISMLIIMFSINFTYGETEEFVRVRIRSPRRFNEQAELDGYGTITVFDLSSGELVELLQLDQELSVLMDAYFDKNYNFLESNDLDRAFVGPIHVRIKDQKYGTYDEVKSEVDSIVEKIGSGFYPYYNGSNYQIYYGAFTDETSTYEVVGKLEEIGLIGEIVSGNKKNVIVYNGSDEIVFSYANNSNIAFTSFNSDISCNMIRIDGKPYRGHMSFNIINDSTLISINRVDMESYLYGVVPCESPSSWPIEALKAQTLAARTYASANLKPFSSYGYDLQDNTYDQVYGGFSSETEKANRAVDETRGEKIYYNGRLIDAVFHSTSGGSTEDSENVWVNALPYLRGVKDEYSNISPYTQWEVAYSKEDIIERLKLYGHDVSDLYDIEITRVSDNNRVLECIFHTDLGKITYTKDSVRGVLGLRSIWFTIAGDHNKFYLINGTGNSNNLPSRGSIIDSILDEENTNEENEINDIIKNLNGLYIISDTKTSKITDTDNMYFISSSGISKVNISSGKSDTSYYVFQGRGWGHGVGMSQYGACQMANEGYTYDQIIKHYYTGVDIQ